MSRPGSTTRWRKLRLLVLARDGYACMVRGPGCVGVASVAGHIVPWIDGGPDDLDNLRAECDVCSNRGGAAIGNLRRKDRGALKGRRDGWS